MGLAVKFASLLIPSSTSPLVYLWTVAEVWQQN
jgi:hypothetical protein